MSDEGDFSIHIVYFIVFISLLLSYKCRWFINDDIDDEENYLYYNILYLMALYQNEC